MPIPPYDFHIHTEYLKCADQTMKIPAIIQECARLGVTTLAITDHLNRPDQLELHLPIKNDILSLDTSIEIYFGAELICSALKLKKNMHFNLLLAACIIVIPILLIWRKSSKFNTNTI